MAARPAAGCKLQESCSGTPSAGPQHNAIGFCRFCPTHRSDKFKHSEAPRPHEATVRSCPLNRDLSIARGEEGWGRYHAPMRIRGKMREVKNQGLAYGIMAHLGRAGARVGKNFRCACKMWI